MFSPFSTLKACEKALVAIEAMKIQLWENLSKEQSHRENLETKHQRLASQLATLSESTAKEYLNLRDFFIDTSISQAQRFEFAKRRVMKMYPNLSSHFTTFQISQELWLGIVSLIVVQALQALVGVKNTTKIQIQQTFETQDVNPITVGILNYVKKGELHQPYYLFFISPLAYLYCSFSLIYDEVYLLDIIFLTNLCSIVTCIYFLLIIIDVVMHFVLQI